MGFQQGLSGLNASSKNLEVIGNNVANANTYGSKVARAEFSDVYAAAINGAGTSTIGIGTNLAAVAQQFTQGNITTTSNPMDLAINGAGFFQVSDGVNPVSYTRNGQFKVDRDGYIVNNAAQRLVGYPADGLGQIQPGQASAIQLPTGGIAPNASTEGLIEANLDADKPVSNPGEVARNLATSTAGDLTSSAGDALSAVDDAVAVLAGITSPSALATAAQTAVAAARTAAAAAETAAQAAADAYPTATQAQAETNAAAAETAAAAAATAAAAAVAAVDTALDAEPANTELTRALTAMQGASARMGTTVTQAAEHAAAVDNVPTAAAGAQIDFDDASTYNDRTTLTFYDVQGREVPVTFYFQKSAAQTWNVFAEVGGVPIAGSAALPAPVTTLQYPEGGGAPISPNGPITLDIPAATNGAGVPTQPIAGVQLDLGGISQYAADFGVTNSQQDGFSAGVLTSIAIEDNGIVSARYSNGQSRPAGQIEIATFRNPQGLQPSGDNNWMRTFASGDPVVGTPGAGNLGVLQSGALEESNVDITGELVNMITAQRIYQANAQSIKTTDQILQTIVNLR